MDGLSLLYFKGIQIFQQQDHSLATLLPCQRGVHRFRAVGSPLASFSDLQRGKSLREEILPFLWLSSERRTGPLDPQRFLSFPLQGGRARKKFLPPVSSLPLGEGSSGRDLHQSLLGIV